nr:type I methionyl aminopeptidase [Actinomycetales bacterium]
MSSLADRAPRGTLTRGTVSPRLPVPPTIERPEYVGRMGPERVTHSDVYHAEEVERIRSTSRLA